jgi:MYXO-CTERM domain-containing protein
MTRAYGVTRRSPWWRRAAVLLVGAVALAAVPVADDARPAGAGASRAVVIVNGSVHVISFGGSVTGLQALRMVAGVTTVGFGGIGEAVCSINGVGNPATPNECLIGPNGEYWAYYRAGPGATGWQYSSKGAGGTSVTDGAVEGWRYGTGGPPGFVSFCAAAGCGPPPTAAPPPPPPPPAAASADTGSAATSTTAAKDAKKGSKGKDGTGGKDGKGEQADGSDGGTAGAEEGDVDVAGEQVAADRRLDGTGDDSGSPVGVIVAVLVALAVVGGGLWYRRRRIKMGT